MCFYTFVHNNLIKSEFKRFMLRKHVRIPKLEISDFQDFHIADVRVPNQASRNVIMIAPFATRGEPLAVVSSQRHGLQGGKYSVFIAL